MTAFVFPGQGSQKRGMGQGLFETVPEFVAVEREVDGILGYSIRKLCLEDAQNQLQQTRFTQPALYVVNALHWYQILRQGQRPSHVAGHSLGEYNALLAAGVFDFVTGLRLVQKRGELMSQATNGGMAAVIGLTATRIAQLLNENKLNTIDIANYNAPLQTVISGPTADINRAAPVFEKAGAQLFAPLRVSAAFHSRYMAQFADTFGSFLASFSFNGPTLPVIANATGQLYTAETVRALLTRQINHSVLWIQSIRLLLDAGVSEFKEIGPGNVLTQLVRQIQTSPNTT